MYCDVTTILKAFSIEEFGDAVEPVWAILKMRNIGDYSFSVYDIPEGSWGLFQSFVFS